MDLDIVFWAPGKSDELSELVDAIACDGCLRGISVTVLPEEFDDGGGGASECSATGGEGEAVDLSGLAIRRPPKVSERLMSPLIASGAAWNTPGRQR